MNYFEMLFKGIYNLMKSVQVPLFGASFSLWTIFLFGTMGYLAVWFLLKFLR